MRPIVETYIQEATEILDGLEATLLALEHERNRDAVDAVFRGLHTVKGSGAMFGFEALARFTHHFETAFDRVRTGTLAVDRALIDLCLEARDRMAAFIALGGDGPEADALERDPATLALLDRLAALTAPGAAPSAAGDASAPLPEPRRFEIRFVPHPDAVRNGMRPDLLLDELSALGEAEIDLLAGDVPALDALDPEESRLGYRIRLTTAADRAGIEDVFLFASDADLSITELPAGAAGAAPAAPVAVADAAAPAPVAAAADDAPADAPQRPDLPAQRPAHAGSVRVPARRLDEMMDQLGELVIAQSRLQRIAERVADPGLEAIAEEMQRLVTTLRDSTLSIRMLPVETVFEKFRRVVRSLSADLGKDVDLLVAGGETELDKNVIDSLSEPLVHMIRNSLDHGLETAEARRGAGKPARGRLSLTARQEGGEVLIAVEDDGRGLDTEAIRRRGVERGLIAADAALPERDIHRLIFEPGFSTAEAVSAVSGRGVGMDAVRRAIDGLRGAIDIASQPGRGSRITLRLPVTLAIIDGLLVRVGRAIYALPLANVSECVEASPDALRHDSGRTMLRVRDAMVPFLDLGGFFGQPTDGGAVRRIVIVATEGRRIGLMVDDILGQNQTVIKTLSPYHREIGVFSGATILGDGRVALIIDVGHLVKAALAASSPDRESQPRLPAA